MDRATMQQMLMEKVQKAYVDKIISGDDFSRMMFYFSNNGKEQQNGDVNRIMTLIYGSGE